MLFLIYMSLTFLILKQFLWIFSFIAAHKMVNVLGIQTSLAHPKCSVFQGLILLLLSNVESEEMLCKPTGCVQLLDLLFLSPSQNNPSKTR